MGTSDDKSDLCAVVPVMIDDMCDSCGNQASNIGVLFIPKKLVICESCVFAARHVFSQLIELSKERSAKLNLPTSTTARTNLGEGQIPLEQIARDLFKKDRGQAS